MGKILTLIIASIFGFVLNSKGQDKCMQDIVFLKNGTKVKGYIVETDSISIKILTCKDNILIVPLTDIVYQAEQPPGGITLFNERRFKPNGFQSQMEILTGWSTLSQVNTGVRFVNGYKFDNRYFVGLGIGTISKYPQYGIFPLVSYPIFTRFSADLWIKRSTPYVFTDFGTQFQNFEYGKLVKPLFIRFGLGNKIIIRRAIVYTNIDYTFNKSRYYYTYGFTGNFSDWYRNHNVGICLGMQFN